MSILCYHSVDPDWRSPLSISPTEFEEQIRWLAANRDVVELPTALEGLDRSFRPPRGTVALTFDDGFAGVAEHAVPVLERYGVHATIFVVADTLTAGGREVDWVDTPPTHRPLQTLTRDQVLDLRDRGFGIGSHSLAHHVLTELSSEACLRDLRTSREILEDLLEEPVRTLAYPRGRHDEMVRGAAARAGFTTAFSLPSGEEHRGDLAVPRVGVYPGNGTLAIRVKTVPAYLTLRTGPLFPFVRTLVKGSPPPRPPG